jgi:hypothetical protein
MCSMANKGHVVEITIVKIPYSDTAAKLKLKL